MYLHLKELSCLSVCSSFSFVTVIKMIFSKQMKTTAFRLQTWLHRLVSACRFPPAAPGSGCCRSPVRGEAQRASTNIWLNIRLFSKFLLKEQPHLASYTLVKRILIDANQTYTPVRRLFRPLLPTKPLQLLNISQISCINSPHARAFLDSALVILKH